MAWPYPDHTGPGGFTNPHKEAEYRNWRSALRQKLSGGRALNEKARAHNAILDEQEAQGLPPIPGMDQKRKRDDWPEAGSEDLSPERWAKEVYGQDSVEDFNKADREGTLRPVGEEKEDESSEGDDSGAAGPPGAPGAPGAGSGSGAPGSGPGTPGGTGSGNQGGGRQQTGMGPPMFPGGDQLPFGGTLPGDGIPGLPPGAEGPIYGLPGEGTVPGQAGGQYGGGGGPFYDANGNPITGTPGSGTTVYDANGNPIAGPGTGNPLTDQLISEYQAAQDRAVARNEARYAQLNAGYAQRTYNAKELLAQRNDQERQDIDARYDRAFASTEQDLIDRGLGNTTVRNAILRGNEESRNDSQQRLAERLTQQSLAMESGLSKDHLDMVERRSDVAPDQAALAALLAQYGASGAGGTGGGGTGAGQQQYNAQGVPINPATGQPYAAGDPNNPGLGTPNQPGTTPAGYEGYVRSTPPSGATSANGGVDLARQAYMAQFPGHTEEQFQTYYNRNSGGGNFAAPGSIQGTPSQPQSTTGATQGAGLSTSGLGLYSDINPGGPSSDQIREQQLQYQQANRVGGGAGAPPGMTDLNGDGQVNFGDYGLYNQRLGQPITRDTRSPEELTRLADQQAQAREDGFITTTEFFGPTSAQQEAGVQTPGWNPQGGGSQVPIYQGGAVRPSDPSGGAGHIIGPDGTMIPNPQAGATPIGPDGQPVRIDQPKRPTEGFLPGEWDNIPYEAGGNLPPVKTGVITPGTQPGQTPPIYQPRPTGGGVKPAGSGGRVGRRFNTRGSTATGAPGGGVWGPTPGGIPRTPSGPTPYQTQRGTTGALNRWQDQMARTDSQIHGGQTPTPQHQGTLRYNNLGTGMSSNRYNRPGSTYSA